jgi:ribosomal protein S24E
MKILENKQNFLLNRKEIKLVVTSEKNPSYEEAIAIVGKEIKTVPENIVIKQVKGKFGRDTFLIVAYVYHSADDKVKFEPKAKKAAPSA